MKMKKIDKYRDDILQGLLYYYNSYTYYNEIYRSTDDIRDIRDEFISVQLLNAWLQFSDKGDSNLLDYTMLFDLLYHLEKEKLVISNNGEELIGFKITPEGIAHLEQTGYIGKNKRVEWEYRLKWFPIIISVIALIVSIIAILKNNSK